jgi:cyclophilin family peptidyl-prolyl cis-trans isomerase
MLERFLTQLSRWSGNRRAACTLIPGLAVLTFLGVAQTIAAAQPPKSTAKPAPAPPKVPAGNPRIVIVIENRGTIVAELLPHEAPKTVAHILALVNRKFYDRILFHRVIADFVAQAGDPKSKKVDGAKLRTISDAEVASTYGLGAGGSGQTVPLEPSIAHERGTLGLARSSNIDSGDSQFFFNLAANHSLDSGYCVFGKIVQGLDVMDKIKQGDRILTIRQVGVTPSKSKK